MSLRSSAERPDHGLRAGDPPAAPGAVVGSRAGRTLIWFLSLPIWLYRYAVSPYVAPRCRFMPSCSEYALEALTTHGPVGGTWMALRRVARCHPWGGFGYDPVPRPCQGPEHQRMGGPRAPDAGNPPVGFAPPQPRISASR